MKNNVRAHTYDMQVIGVGHPDSPMGWPITAERCERVQICLDYIARRVKELKTQFPGSTVVVLSENRTDPGGAFGRTDWWGTCDVTLICGTDPAVHFVEVIDYKDGRGYVRERDNTQLLSYLFGEIRPIIASGPDHVRPFMPFLVGGCRTTIVQPKTHPPIRYCDVAPGEVVALAEELSLAAARTDDPDATPTPDDRNGKGHCNWCRANPKRGGDCPALLDRSAELMKVTEIEGIDALLRQIHLALESPETLPGGYLAGLVAAKETVISLFKRAEETAIDHLNQGKEVPGYALTTGKPTKRWAEGEDEVAKKLRNRKLSRAQIYPAKLITPAQVMKLDNLTDHQKHRIETEMVQVTYGPKRIVPLIKSDKTDKNTPESLFGDLPANKPSEEISFF
jgi:hypothetical protein